MSFQAAMAGLQIAGNVAGGIQNSAILRRKAKGFKQQAQIDTLNADRAYDTGLQNSSRTRSRGKQVAASQKAIMAASGIAYEGSAVDVVEETTELAELDALMAKYDGEVQKVSLDYSAAVNTYQAKLAKKAARESLIGSFIGAGALVGAHSMKGGALHKPSPVQNSSSFFRGGFSY